MKSIFSSTLVKVHQLGSYTMATRMSSISGPSGYLLVPLREGAESRFLLGDFAEALAAADNAKALHSVAAGQIQFLDCCHYAWLTAAALYENASADEQTGWRGLLTAHQEQLREGGNDPPKFADKHALVSAEIARLEGRDFDTMQLYEQAIVPQARIENTVLGRLH